MSAKVTSGPKQALSLLLRQGFIKNVGRQARLCRTREDVCHQALKDLVGDSHQLPFARNRLLIGSLGDDYEHQGHRFVSESE